jgi:mono/diheme cytochrome c family protein
MALAGVVCFCVVGSMAGASGAQGTTRPPRQDYNSGEYLYRVFCASCHGADGAGDGIVADVLRLPPANLTMIAARNGGAFPRDRVYAAIDGRQKVNGHGPAQMPVWGDVLKVTEGQNEGVIKKRIDSLVAYLETFQRKP